MLLYSETTTMRRGLEAMLQKRKRLLMYLRRTKWDNYSMLITRLGLKDNHMRMVCTVMVAVVEHVHVHMHTDKAHGAGDREQGEAYQ